MTDPAHLKVEHHIIGPGTKFSGGIFLGRAAIFVDIEENPGPYEYAYRVVDGILTEDDQTSPFLIAAAVNTVVRGILPFSSSTWAQILKEEAKTRGVLRLNQTHKLGLSKSIFEGGRCHEQTLMKALLLELLQERRGIGGEASIDPPSTVDSHPDRHVWARYTRDGQRIVMESGPSGSDRVMKLVDGTKPGANPIDVQVSRRYLRPGELNQAA